MQDVGAAWLMTSLAPPPIMVALVETATTMPMFLLALPAGALADIVDRRRLLIVTQGWMLVAAAGLGILTFLGITTPWVLLTFTFLLGLGAAMNAPAWQAIVPELVPIQELPAAIALNSVGFNMSRAIGPALGGFVVAAAGPYATFLLNAVTFLGVSLTITVEGYERTASILTEGLGFRYVSEAGNRFRYEVGPGGSGTLIDVLCLPDGTMGKIAVGTVHHVAWRAANDDEQKVLRQEIVKLGLNVTPVLDRNYFRSIYFREPGGVLFEIATDPPGFGVDESPEKLGTKLQLPSWLEPSRAKIEQILPPLRLPKVRD